MSIIVSILGGFVCAALITWPFLLWYHYKVKPKEEDSELDIYKDYTALLEAQVMIQSKLIASSKRIEQISTEQIQLLNRQILFYRSKIDLLEESECKS